MEKHLGDVANLVENDLKKWLCEARSRLRNDTGGQDNDAIVSEFIASSSEHINENIAVSNVLIEQETSYLQDLFGKSWNRMCRTSKTSLVSVGVLWRSCARIRNVDFDFSGICISATSALEAELKKVFFIDFQKYMERTYGKPDHRKWEETFQIWPENLLSWNRNDYERQVRESRHPYLELQKIFTMGMVPFFMGRYDRRSERAQDTLLHNKMNEYLGTVVKDDYKEMPLLLFYQNDNPECFVKRCENVRNSYRNPAAHTDILSKCRAETCYRTVVGEREMEEFSSNAHGLIISLYSYFK